MIVHQLCYVVTFVRIIFSCTLFFCFTSLHLFFFFFFFNDTATTEIYTLSLHDALPIWVRRRLGGGDEAFILHLLSQSKDEGLDRKSTRLNSSHVRISYAVFCLKKKKKTVAHEI